jgi:uncharacterized protein YhbP (UPF0306 family)
MIDGRIIKFLKRHHVMTIATSAGNKPWCASCFYAYMKEDNLFVLTTEDDTKHGKEFAENPVVAGSVALETMIAGKIRGIQLQGTVYKPEGDELGKAKIHYLKRFPVAALMDIHLWVIKPAYIKMTDNKLGFGRKLTWTAEQ